MWQLFISFHYSVLTKGHFSISWLSHLMTSVSSGLVGAETKRVRDDFTCASPDTFIIGIFFLVTLTDQVPLTLSWGSRCGAVSHIFTSDAPMTPRHRMSLLWSTLFHYVVSELESNDTVTPKHQMSLVLQSVLLSVLKVLRVFRLNFGSVSKLIKYPELWSSAANKSLIIVSFSSLWH